MITLAQIDTQIDSAWSAINLGELSYNVRGRELRYHSLSEFQSHINWLLELRQNLLGQAAVAAGDPLCPVVQYQNSE